MAVFNPAPPSIMVNRFGCQCSPHNPNICLSISIIE